MTSNPETGSEEADDSARRNGKSETAFRTISEVSGELGVPQHVLRFWETKFSQIRPMKRGGGRRYYRPEDVALLAAIRDLLYNDGYTIKGAQKLLRENGVKTVVAQTETLREGGAGEQEAPDGEAAAAAPPAEEREPSFAFSTPEAAPEENSRPSEAVVDVEPASGVSESASDVVEAGEPVEPEPASELAPERPQPTVIAGGLGDDQRLELETLLAELEDLRRILKQAGVGER